MQTTVPEVEGYYFIQITTVEEVSPSSVFCRNYDALVACNPKEKYKIDSLENALYKISNYIYKEKSFHMKLCPVNFWMKVNPHLERNCSVNNVLVFAAVKGALRK